MIILIDSATKTFCMRIDFNIAKQIEEIARCPDSIWILVLHYNSGYWYWNNKHKYGNFVLKKYFYSHILIRFKTFFPKQYRIPTYACRYKQPETLALPALYSKENIFVWIAEKGIDLKFFKPVCVYLLLSTVILIAIMAAELYVCYRLLQCMASSLATLALTFRFHLYTKAKA